MICLGTRLRALQRIHLLDPQVESSLKHAGKRLLDMFADLARMIACAEMSEDDLFVLEAMPALDNVVQVHVPMLVDQLRSVRGSHERHLGNQDFGLIHGGAFIQPARITVAQIRYAGNACFLRYVDPR